MDIAQITDHPNHHRQYRWNSSRVPILMFRACITQHTHSLIHFHRHILSNSFKVVLQLLTTCSLQNAHYYWLIMSCSKSDSMLLPALLRQHCCFHACSRPLDILPQITSVTQLDTGLWKTDSTALFVFLLLSMLIVGSVEEA